MLRQPIFEKKLPIISESQEIYIEQTELIENDTESLNSNNNNTNNYHHSQLDTYYAEQNIIFGYSTLLFSLTSLVYLILLATKLTCIDNSDFLWIYTNIPLSILLISLMFLLITYFELDKCKLNLSTKCELYIGIALLAVCLFTFSWMATCYLDHIWEIELWNVFVPLYFFFFIALMTMMLTLTKIMNKKARVYRGICVLMLYYTAGLLFTLFISLKVLEIIDWSYCPIMSIIGCALILHLMLLLSDDSIQINKIYSELMFILSVGTSLLFISYNLDHSKEYLAWNITFFSLYIGDLFILGFSLIHLCEKCTA